MALSNLFDRFCRLRKQITVELQWLEQVLDHENWFESQVVLASQGKCLYLLTEL